MEKTDSKNFIGVVDYAIIHHILQPKESKN